MREVGPGGPYGLSAERLYPSCGAKEWEMGRVSSRSQGGPLHSDDALSGSDRIWIEHSCC